jgi:hypothetical protein
MAGLASPIVLTCGLLLAAFAAVAQDDEPAVTEATAEAAAGSETAATTEPPARDLTLPPMIASNPGETRFEAPPEEREDVLEAVVTGGQTDWRLPDLGSSIRAEQEAREPDQRIELGFVPLYDPADPEATAEFLSPEAEVMRGVGMIRLIELRLGRQDEAAD